MTHQELRQAAIEYLGKVFKGDEAKVADAIGGQIEVSRIQAAVSIVLSPEPEPRA